MITAAGPLSAKTDFSLTVRVDDFMALFCHNRSKQTLSDTSASTLYISLTSLSYLWLPNPVLSVETLPLNLGLLLEDSNFQNLLLMGKQQFRHR